MNLSDFSIRKPYTIFMAVVALLIFGFVSLPKMAIELYPDLNIPVAVVVTSVEGATPAEAEKLVTKPLESVLSTVPNLKEISSNSSRGSSQVILQFNWGTDMAVAVQDIRDKVDLARGILPDNANSPRILKIDPNSEPIITLSLTGDMEATKLKSIAENTIKPYIERIDGVGSVGVVGGEDRVINVTLDPNKLQAYGLTIDQVKQALTLNNVSNSGGMIREGDTNLGIRIQGEFEDVESIKNTPISLGSAHILLQNIANIEDTLKEVSQISYLDGKNSVSLTVTKASGGNTVKVAEEVQKAVKELENQIPKQTSIEMISDASVFITDSIHMVTEHAVIGGLVSIFVLFLFLNSIRSMIIVSIVIPISVIGTFSLMYFTGQTINMISLAGLTLGLGSLVDFAVVIMENIFRFRQQGKGMIEAAKLGSSQVGTAVMASALAQIVVFVPIVFVEGLASEIFGPLALTVIFSHIAALIFSISMVPLLSAYWLKELPDESLYHNSTYRGKNPVIWFNIGFEKFSNLYMKFLGWALNHRKTVFTTTIGMFIIAGAFSTQLGTEFIPEMDRGEIAISVKLPNGTKLGETEKVIEEIEYIVKDIPELKQLYVSIGGSGGPSVLSTSTSNRGQLNLKLTDILERKRTTKEVMEEVRTKVSSIVGAEIEVGAGGNSGGAPTGAALQVNLRGDNLETLEDISMIIAGEIKKVEGTRNVSTSLEETQKEYQLKVNKEMASQYGLNTSQIISAVRTSFQGETVTRYRTGDDEIDVVVKFPKEYKEDINFLQSLRITTVSGAKIPLSSVVKVEKEAVPQTIARTNQTRQVQITSDIVGRDLGTITKEVESRLNQLSLPEGYFIEYGGQSKDMAESFGSLGLAIILSIALVYMVMVSQFQSLFSPFIIMFSIPPTFIGVVFGLLITGESLSVTALIGYILLIGIVVNNAIVLIDFVNTLRKQGMERNEAVLQAGPIRLRPILMTTFTTILAVLPLAFGSGSGAESQAGMAIVVSFGLSFSTVITLVLIPVVYTWFDDIGIKNKKRMQKWVKIILWKKEV